jgi:hypothetical protein
MGNDLVYRTHDPQKIAASVEEVVRRDVGSNVPLAVQTTIDTAEPLTARRYLADLGRLLAERPGTVLATLEFDLPGPRAAHLVVRMVRNGLIAYAGSLVYVIDLRGSVDGPVGLDEHKMFTKPRFHGGRTADRLNAVESLAKLADDVLASVAVVGALTLQLPRIFELGATEHGCRLVIRTLPHKTSLLGPMSTGAGRVLEIANLVEGAL